MKISNIKEADVAKFLRLEAEDYTIGDLEPYMAAAISYIEKYTGIPQAMSDTAEETLDSHEDLYIAYMVLCQDMYDNRTYYVDSQSANRVVENILGLHNRNLVR